MKDPESQPPSTEAETPPKKTLFPETDLDRGIVGWDGQDDPANPQNFPSARKWGLLVLMNSIAVTSALTSSIFAPPASFMAAEFGESNRSLIAFSVSIFLLGYTFGPLLLAPLSEIYGRRIIFSCSSWFFIAWQIGCALAPNMSSLIVFRFLTGVGGVGSITIGTGVIADLFPVQRRGLAASIWGAGALIGPVIGPVCGGFIGEAIGWRWVFWILMIACGTFSSAVLYFNRETYAPVLLRWKTARVAKETGRTDLRSAYDADSKTPPSSLQVIRKGLKRPAVLFFKSPIVFLLAMYMALVYGMLYLFFTTVPTVFQQQYGFSVGLSGLAYLGIGFGFFTGLTLVASTSDKVVMKLAARNNGQHEPEMRLPFMIFFASILPISFFWYGWSADKQVHWIVPIIGMFPFGVGLMGIYLPIQAYLIDCYPAHAASANATLIVTRSMLGALLPLAGPSMFESLGLGWGNSLLGFLALAFVPTPIFFNQYGKVIRERFPVNLS